MKYFRTELLDKMYDRSATKEEREQAEIEWEKNCLAYKKESDKVSKKLPRKIVKIMNDGFFHDATIESISFVKQKREIPKYKLFYNVVITLNWQGMRGELIHHDVSVFNTSIAFSNTVLFYADYLYGEILLIDGKWTHDFLLIDYSEVNISCKKITWKDSKQ